MLRHTLVLRPVGVRSLPDASTASIQHGSLREQTLLPRSMRLLNTDLPPACSACSKFIHFVIGQSSL